MEIGQGLEKEREGVVVGHNGGVSHVGIQRERKMWGFRVGEGSNEGIVNEDVCGWF